MAQLHSATTPAGPVAQPFNLGIRSSVVSAQGQREYQEDSYGFYRDMVLVVDGHGGSAVASIVSSSDILQRFNNVHPMPAQLEQANFLDFLVARTRLLYRWLDQLTGMYMQVGAVLAAYQVIEYGGAVYVVASNLGDCRVILVGDGKIVQLTEDHTPERLVADGRLLPQHVIPDAFGTPRVGGVLAVAGSLGDNALLASGLYKEPYVSVTRLRPGSSYHVVAASDGLWNFVTNEAVDRTVREAASQGTPEITRRLLQLAFDSRSNDNVTIVVSELTAGAPPGVNPRDPTGLLGALTDR